MKFRYEYRTRDNILHEDVIVAKSRDAVFSKLVRLGVKPSRVWQLPDPMHRLKVVAWSALALFVLTFGGVVLREHVMTANPETRKQLQGDPVFIERGVANDWADVFADPVDRYLARYAQPGWRIRFTADGESRCVIANALTRNVDKRVRYADSDVMELRQLKRIVAGIRNEAGEFIAAGGDAEKFLSLLDERQRRESDVYFKLTTDFADVSKNMNESQLYDAWVNCNRKLKSMGLKMISLPERVVEIKNLSKIDP